jgi:hypothetical protein
LAAFLSFLIPGLGHLYVWAYERAFMIWATIAVSIFMIINGFWGFSFLIAFVYFFGRRRGRRRPRRQARPLRHGLAL